MKHNIASFFENSDYHMADVSGKVATYRRAVAMGRINVGAMAFEHIKNQTLPKGDVLKLAEIAGITGAKNTSQTIPLCHPLPLDHVAVYLELEENTASVAAYCLVATYAKTGVEMEALAGVNAALLTMYDLTKPVEPALIISDTRLLIKEGGKKGTWVHPDGIPEDLQKLLPTESERPLEGINAAVITLSDRAYKGEYEDKSGVILKGELEFLGCNISDYCIIPDESAQLEQKILDLVGSVELIITTGGTGIAPRDITPETISKLANVEIPGIGELLRSSGAQHISTSWLSRSLAVIIDDTLVISLPGSSGGVKDGMEALKAILPHALDHAQDKKNIHDNLKKEHAA